MGSITWLHDDRDIAIWQLRLKWSLSIGEVLHLEPTSTIENDERVELGGVAI